MLLLWIMVGLTVVVLLILNIKLVRRSRTERRQRELKAVLDKEATFLKNCALYQLSEREMEVLRLMLEGHTYRSAAEILFISEKTIDAHLRSIYSKTGVKNKVELVVKFYS
ncbi:response regulator transcription factor [Mucilaginibacter sp. AK015]|uniref:response regulator transcription factor n=1 Tax=Mucilaginibacter sp. AK015 TaxID=2723072 RepID=UPI00161AEB19|nr:helix-turn-helix transcriptional regulator [Mucilaginibacter sp. AK015]MBB5396669.1 DNA-binding CsgD family transcriptional regulator [Mucilaginibacter sp. AK015]